MDNFFMQKALRLAKKGLSWTWPNPMVGAVLVNVGKVIGQGYHHKAGGHHAEIEAIQSSKTNLKGATLYVNLEPCSHYGKTPPCSDAIIRAGVKRVVYSTLDPNPKVAGKGIEKLKQAGIDVTGGILEKEAKKLNEAFFTFHTKKRPFVAIKFAASLDGKIATRTGDSKWITNEKARMFARRLRGEYQAILVGVNTVLKDNPNLGTRIRGLKDPLRVILDPHQKIQKNAEVFRDDNVLVINKKIAIADLLEFLKQKNIISVLVEGGGKTIGGFVDAGLVDKAYAFHAPIIIGGEKSVSSVSGVGFGTIKEALHLKDVKFNKFEDTMLTTGYAS